MENENVEKGEQDQEPDNTSLFAESDDESPSDCTLPACPAQEIGVGRAKVLF